MDTIKLAQDTMYVAQNVITESEILKLSQQFYQDSFANLLTVMAIIFSIGLAVNIWSVFRVNKGLKDEVEYLVNKSKIEFEQLSQALKDEIEATKEQLNVADIKLEAAIEFTQAKLIEVNNPIMAAAYYLKSAVNHARIKNDNAFSALVGAMFLFKKLDSSQIERAFRESFNKPEDFILLFAKACNESKLSPPNTASAIYDLKYLLESKGFNI